MNIAIIKQKDKLKILFTATNKFKSLNGSKTGK